MRTLVSIPSNRQRSRLALRFFLALAAGLFSIGLAAAEETSSGGQELLRGFSLQFGLGGTDTNPMQLTSTLGNLIGGKFHFDPADAIRFGLSLFLSDNNYSYVDGSQSEATISTSSFVLDYLHYLNPGDPIKAYVGIGATAGMTVNGWTFTSFNAPLPWDVGARASLGAEWFFTRNLSLLAEYGAAFTYSRVSMNDGTAHYEAITSFSPAGVRLALSVYLGR